MKKWVVLSALGVAGLAILEPALAKTAGEIGAHIASQGEGMGKAVSSLFYVGGMAAGGGAFMKLKANRDSPQQNPLSHAIVLGLVCAGLLFLPTTFKTAGDSLYTSSATKNDIGGTTTIGN
ncbi:MAG: hypothetical protein H6970_16050 [Gammaproteobacteria bacterium]|nr:hypothetical protein [Gammaproteobacteria bacterium]MCP5426559.1 hypothetical protein [Gammaproteobacteria bacterium]MCP5458736.1 hypothetical protein [Gammaproteobacteria bacterium]MCP5460083.1 hypothetical protein [Gammaproteobacteria bacterium]